MAVIKTGSAAWAKATGAGVKVGVIDGGLDLTHPDLAGAIDVGRSCSFIFSTTPTADPAEIANGDCTNKAAVQDLQGHGTHVATTIAGRLNGIGIAGVAPQATVVGLKACTIAGFCFADSVAAALRYAGDHKLDVVNLSLFADPYLYFCANDAGQRAMLLDLQKVARYAEQRGVVIVAAAGNEAQDLGHPTEDTISPDWPPDTAIVRTVRNQGRVAPAELPGDGLRTRAYSRWLVEHRRHWHLGGFDPGEPRGRQRWRPLCVDQWYVDGVTARRGCRRTHPVEVPEHAPGVPLPPSSGRPPHRQHAPQAGRRMIHGSARAVRPTRRSSAPAPSTRSGLSRGNRPDSLNPWRVALASHGRIRPDQGFSTQCPRDHCACAVVRSPRQPRRRLPAKRPTATTR